MKVLRKGFLMLDTARPDEPDSSCVDGAPMMDMKAQSWSNTALNPVGLIIRQKDPNNLEMPFDQLSDFITPSELFYIRSHFPIPEFDPVAFRLLIRGAVWNELSLSYAAIRAMPSRKCVAALECAGNSRVFLRRRCPARNGTRRGWHR